MFCAAMMLRPTLLGDSFSFLGSILILLCGAYVFSRQGFDGPLLRMELLSQGSAVLLWLFLMVHSALNGVTNFYALSAFLQITASSIGVLLCFSNSELHRTFFVIFRVYLAFCGASLVATVVLSLVVGLDALYVTPISTIHYNGSSELYLPFTLAYGYKECFGVLVPRSGSGFRESGIAQAFFACAIVSMPELKTLRHWVMFGLLVVGGLGALSTAGMSIVGIASGIRLIRIDGVNLAIRAAFIVLSLYLAVIAVDFSLNDESVGFAAKIDTDSYQDRSLQTDLGLHAFYTNPLGYGAYSENFGAGINLIANLGSIGVFGALLVLVNLLLAILGSRNKLEKALFVAPLFFTSLISQPLLDAALVYLFFGYAGAPRRHQLVPKRPTPIAVASRIPRLRLNDGNDQRLATGSPEESQ
jgi:hypothetical protein